MKRVLLALAAVVFLGAAAGAYWLNSDSGAVRRLDDAELDRARESGEAAREIRAQADDVALPSLREIKDTTDRAQIDAWFAVADRALGEASDADRGDLLIVTAELERARGNLQRAIELSREGAQLMPSNSRARYAYGCAIMSSIKEKAGGRGVAALATNIGATKEFIREVTVALELDPSNHDARCKLIAVRAFAPFILRDRKGAAELIEGIAEHRSEFDRDFWRAQLLVSDGDFDEALEALGALRSQMPDDPDVIAAVGDVYFKAERFREAAEAYDSIAEKGNHPRNIEALYQAAKSRELGGFEPERALAQIERFEELDPVGELLPTRDRVAYHKGVILSSLGRSAEARAALEEAERINPGTSRVKKALAALDADGG